MDIWDALHKSVPFVQFKKREKHPWRIVKPATLLKVNFTKDLQLY